jgi:hypothetical protein
VGVQRGRRGACVILPRSASCQAGTISAGEDVVNSTLEGPPDGDAYH